MSDFTKKGSIIFGLIMFALGVVWYLQDLGWLASNINVGSLVVLWVGIGCLGYSLSKYTAK